ncbi:hypothetical protein N7474_001193 [Penicillium riverlandense]|uniref:uncharacterized protein n=1 Tax=Penicillium riverlandense TaxID=1903569 RepID=UPI002548639B|nr:uncharacterized protein N7474_001193 [Penicillium riverlandense]KAJ5832882.1 hypothetical protein N7474_001193 [Penicillium riverlandense]
MIDDNLPTFFIKNNNPQKSQNCTVYYQQHGNDPEPAYALRYLDPAVPTSHNRYGVGLYDPYVKDVVYGEVAVVPEWSQPSLSAEMIRANGGTAPPAEPVLPTQFTIQLYNPDQQILVRHKAKSWNTPARWEFEMPQRTFRVPSASTLDRTQSDPAAEENTPKLRFSWRKDGKLSKDLTCLLHGKSATVPDTRTKSREPDITVALFQGLREVTLYEPNLYRVEMEDFKGLEVVLLLAAIAIRDIFFGPAKEAFHITAVGVGQSSTRPQGAAPSVPNGNKPSPPRLNIPAKAPSLTPQQRRRQEEIAREEERRTKELLAKEEKERRRKEAAIEQETKRLQQLYGREEQEARAQSTRPSLPPRPGGGPSRPYSMSYSQSSTNIPSSNPSYFSSSRPAYPPRPQWQQGAPAPTSYANSPYLHVSQQQQPGRLSTSHLPQPRPQSSVGFSPQPTSSGALPPGARPNAQVQPKKSSFLGFLKNRDEPERATLQRKRSSMF